jgi:hypothetical protein
MDLEDTVVRNDCAGEDQQQFNQPTGLEVYTVRCNASVTILSQQLFRDCRDRAALKYTVHKHAP